MEKDIKSILNGLRHISTQLEKLSSHLETFQRTSSTEWKSQSDEVDKISAALVQAQKETGKMNLDSSGYNHKYASLPGIMDHVKDPYNNNGISIRQDLEEINGKDFVVTTLRHESGQWIRSKTSVFLPTRSEIPNTKNYNQECGAAYSYMKRYALESIVFVKGDKDDYDKR